MTKNCHANSRDLVELAAMVVGNAGLLLDADRPLAEPVLQAYWSACKCRQQRWHSAFKRYQRVSAGCAPEAVQAAWRSIRSTIDEILGSEVLARVWAAVLCEQDQRRRTTDVGPIARNVLLGHLEARHRALNIMVFGRGASIAESVQLNRTRRRYEQWSDLLLGALQAHCVADEFAVEPARARRFAVELVYQGRDIASSSTWQWILATMRSSMLEQLICRAPNGDLNAQIAASILAAFGDERQNLIDAVSSPWMRQLEYVSTDTFGDVAEQLFQAHANRGKDSAASWMQRDDRESTRGGESRYWR